MYLVVILILGLVSSVRIEAATVLVTQEVRVSASEDDAEEAPSGYFSTTSSDLELVEIGLRVQTVGMRFDGIDIPQGYVVSNAYIQFQVDEPSSGTVALTIRGEAQDNAAVFSLGAGNILSRAQTTAAVAWSPADWLTPGDAGPDQRTPDIATLIQEIVDRPGWVIGSSLAIMITGSGTRVAEAFDGDQNGAPLLHVEYVLSDQEAPTVTAGPDQAIFLPSSASLNGAVQDDGLPFPPGLVTTTWSQVSGPGTADFVDTTAIETSASFSLAGIYVLRVRATDGERVASDDITITVHPAISPPLVSSFSPSSAQVATVVTIAGNNFSDAQTVTFNGISSAFWVPADDTIHATVPTGVTNGPIAISNLTGTTISSADFNLVPSPPVLVGAGDISRCSSAEEETAKLLDTIAGTVFTAGDNAYSDGTLAEYNDCYESTWGRHKARTRPIPGNHEYHTTGAAGYYTYFGPAAGEPDKGYYSYDIGDWHIIALNSECEYVGGCNADSPQGQWLRTDLIQHPSVCTLAYWHKPRFSSSSRHGSDATYTDFWQILVDAGAELVISGHDHAYERFAPQDANGIADLQRGIRQFVVGTGGTGLYPTGVLEPNSEVSNTISHGVLKLTLNPTSYDWEFVPIAGQVFSDSGTGLCHQENQMPVVEAGPDQVISSLDSALLEGSALDDGLLDPPGILSTTWSQISGPGSANFVDNAALDTAVSFSQLGSYVLRLSANDGEFIVTDDVTIISTEAGTQAVIFENRVLTSSDDAEEKSSGSMSLTSSDLELVADGSEQLVGMRFNEVAIPQGTLILNAYVQFQVDEVSPDSTSLTIEGEAADSSFTFTSANGNVSTRSRTSASTAWFPAAWPTVGEANYDQQTPDLSGVIQEIVNRPGWTNGNSLTIIISGTGRRTAESYDGNQAAAPLLRVQYAMPTDESPTVSITAPANGSTFAEGNAVNFSGTANDNEDGDLGASLTWSSSIDGAIGSGAAFSWSGLSIGTHLITASVTDSSSISGSAHIILTIEGPPNNAPSVSINAPADGSTFIKTAADTAGVVNFFVDAESDFNQWTLNPSAENQMWMRDNYYRMQTYSSYFDSRLSWYPNAWVYLDSYAIKPSSTVFSEHPEWVLRDANGEMLYIPFECSGGTCPQFAADIGNADFRAWWIGDANSKVDLGYGGIWIDDVNFEWRISNGNGDLVLPIDPRTNSEMTLDDWRGYLAEFMEELRENLPDIEIAHNINWAAQPTDDSNILRAIDAADYVNLERGITDSGIVDGSGKYGFETFLALVDRVHARGRHVIMDDDDDDSIVDRDYELAFYFLINNGGDMIGADGDRGRMNPDNFWPGYSFDLGNALGDRYIWNELFRRDFECGMVLVNQPERPTVTVNLGDTFIDLEGQDVTAVSVAASSGQVLKKSCIGEAINFSGTAIDNEDGDLGTDLVWSSSIDGAIGTGTNFGSSSLSLGAHLITASVSDSGGSSGSAQISLGINAPPNTAPSVSITAPADSSTFTQGEAVTFSGTATDVEDGDLGAGLAWSSSIDGAIGSGTAFTSANLSSGVHVITASVSDAGGLPDENQITITITAVMIDVPDVLGLVQATAEANIVGAGLTVGTVATATSETVPAGDVISQSPVACTTCAAPGSAVDLVVSTGAATIDVPSVVGLVQATAEANIVTAGLTVGTVATATSETVPAGDVVSQSPVACTTCAAPGSAVDLVVSTGPAPNTPPVVTVTGPVNGTTVTEGTAVVFTGSASDVEDLDLTTGLAWSSSLSGLLPGSGGSITATLSIGSHTITASVTDSGGLPGSDSITVEVLPVGGVPQTLDVRISASADDAEENGRGNVALTSSDLEMIFDRQDQTVGLRFNGIDIPPGATIIEAYIQFTVDEASSDPTSLTIEGEAGGNAAQFTNSAFNISSRPRTSASVAWSPVPWTTVGEADIAQQTPDLSGIISETINGGSWAADNALAFIVTGSGERVAESFNGDADNAALLHIRFLTTGGNASPTVNISAPTDGSTVTEGAELTFNASANDFEDGDVSASLSWTSSLDGVLPGAGSGITAMLSVGAHLITATAVDSTGQAASDTTSVTVTPTGGSPQTLNIQISSGADDAEQRANGSVSLTSSDLELVFDNSDQTVGLRFNNVTIEPGALVTQAWIQFTVDEASSVTTDLLLQGEANASAAQFTNSAFNISSRLRTSASVAWSPAPWTTVGEADVAQQTPNLSGIISEIINGGGWSAGNSLAIIVTGSGERVAESFNGQSGSAAILHIEYVAGGGNPPP